MGNQGGPEYNAPAINNNNDKEENKSGDGESSSFKDGYMAGLKQGAKGAYKGAQGAYNKVTGKKPSVDQYDTLDGNNEMPDLL